jgi:hypothetical protein
MWIYLKNNWVLFILKMSGSRGSTCTIWIFGWFLDLLNYPCVFRCTNLHTTVFWNDTTCRSSRATHQILRETSCLHLILWRQMQYVPLLCWFLSTELPGFTFQANTSLILTTLRIYNLIYQPYLFLCWQHFYSQKVAGLIECRSLNVGLDVHIIAQNLGQCHLAYLCQLCLCEPDGLVFVFIPAHTKRHHIIQ